VSFTLNDFRAYGSPTKRKRGTASGGRGTGSPAGPSTPNVDYILGHLDILRVQMKEEGIFCTDIMQAALLQVKIIILYILSMFLCELRLL